MRHGLPERQVLSGHALRNANLRRRSLERSQSAPPLAAAIVHIRAELLGLTRIELCRQSDISRGTLRDMELGVHKPTRRTMQKFLDFCTEKKVGGSVLEEVRRLYAGGGETLLEFIADLELRAGSPRELARRTGISVATLWEYRRGNFPLPLPLLRRMCEVVGADCRQGEELWRDFESRRLRERGYPPALAELQVLCQREGLAERHLLERGLSYSAARKMRYLELPPWQKVEEIARVVCRDQTELRKLQQLWHESTPRQPSGPDPFGRRVQQLRRQGGLSRRELADLFDIGGKKPARIIKHIEEDGFYSAQAYPAGIVALLTDSDAERAKLAHLWSERRGKFHRRRRPETRIELRLKREWYGFSLADMEPILGYSSAEYQRLERGVTPLLDSAYQRILEAIDKAGRRRVQSLLAYRDEQAQRRRAWMHPTTVAEMVELLAEREGGIIPLARVLRQANIGGLWPARLRAIAQGKFLPPWQALEKMAETCGINDTTAVRVDWAERCRQQLQKQYQSPLSVEIRFVIAEVSPTLRDFSKRLGFNYSVLVRDLQRIDRDEPIAWFHVERILRAAQLPANDDRCKEIRALWSTAGERTQQAGYPPRRKACPSFNGGGNGNLPANTMSGIR
ncbi:MAG: hypothetical protein KatS3mg105_4894 [Gemmatales bacterium]|nr:MAG: hypothetical protein KatS3mg105_4894 [Gemmatales bacterium]